MLGTLMGASQAMVVLFFLRCFLQQLHDQFMEGFADLCTKHPCEPQKIKHVVAGDGTVRVPRSPVCVQELNVGKLRQETLRAGSPWHSFASRGWASHLEVTNPGEEQKNMRRRIVFSLLTCDFKYPWDSPFSIFIPLISETLD